MRLRLRPEGGPVRRFAPDSLVEHLGRALDDLLAAVVLANGLPDDEPPGEALDAALRADEACREARKELSAALEAVRGLHPSEDALQALMAVEAAANDLAAETATVGFRLGCRVARSGCQVS